MRIMLITMLLPLLAFAQVLKQRDLPKELRGNMVPDFFIIPEDNRGELERDDLKKNLKPGAKRIVLLFFATWCIPCVEEFVLLKENQEKLEKEGIQIYLVNVFKSEIVNDPAAGYDKVKSFVKKYAGDSFPLYYDPHAGVLEDFGLAKPNEEELNLPATIILDSSLSALGAMFGKSEKFPNILWEEF